MYFKPHCAPKLACLNKNNPKIPIVKEREWTNFKRKYFECQDVQIQQSTCMCNLFLQSYAYRQEKKRLKYAITSWSAIFFSIKGHILCDACFDKKYTHDGYMLTEPTTEVIKSQFHFPLLWFCYCYLIVFDTF